jgi:tape measure domain-containing protein
VSVVANVAINVDSRNAVSKLRQVRQGAQATSQAVDKLNATAAATRDKFKIAANGVKYFTDAAGRARAENGRFLTTAERAAAGIEAQGNAAQKASGKFKGLQNALASLGAGLAVRKAFIDASELESAQSRIGLLVKNFQQLSGIQGVAANAAVKFNLSQSESLSALTDLGNRIGPTGASLEDIVNVYEGFNTLLALNKVNTQNAASATLQLNQALGSGRLAGEEFNAISEATPQLLDAVAKVLGRNRGELKQLASDGEISSQVLIEALKRIRTEGAADLETAFSGAFGATRRFDVALKDFSATIGTELLPALTPLISGATEILKLFGQLPGPVKSLIAAVAGLTAAFVVLAPAISTAIGLLSGLSLATLAAAGPWVALAAGITTAVVALASYQSQSQKVAGAARTGTAADVVAARNLSVQKGQQISLLEQQRKTAKGRERASIDRSLTKLRGEQTGLQSAIAASTADRPVVTDAGMAIPAAAPTGGKTKGSNKSANDAERAAEAAKQEAERVKDVIRNRLAEGQIIAVKTQQQDRIAAAEAAGDKMLVARLQSQERELDIQYRYAQELAKEIDLDAQKAIIYEGQNALTANQLDLQRQLDELQRQSDQDRLTAVQKHIEKQYELNTAVQRQQQLADGIANTLGEGMTSAFNAIIQGSESFGASLKRIASGVLIDIANQLLRIFVIEQAINAIKGVISSLSPFSAATPLGAGGGMVGKFGTLGPNFGIPQRAKGGPVMGGSPYIVGERGPELFVPGSSGTIIPNDKMGGGVSIVVNVDASGSKVEGDEQEGKQLGRVIAAAIQQELVKQKRPGGLLA